MYDAFVVNEEGRCDGGGRVGLVSLHSLSMIDTRRVAAGGGVGIFVFKGFGRLDFLGLFAARLLFMRLRIGAIQVPGQWR